MEASYELKKMTDEERRYMLELLSADLEKKLFEMINQTMGSVKPFAGNCSSRRVPVFISQLLVSCC